MTPDNSTEAISEKDDDANRVRTRTRARSTGDGGRTRARSGRSRQDGSSDDTERGDKSSRNRGSSGSGRGGGSAKSSSKGSGKSSGDGDGKGSSRGRRRRRGRRGGGKGSDSSGGSARTSDKELEKAIAKSGTRAATRRAGSGRRRSQEQPGGVPEEVRRAILDGPPKTMLVTARDDRTQIGVLEDRRVVEHYVTRKEDVTYVGNIYMARVQNVLPGMEAAFLDIGKGRNGVLYAGEVLYDELDVEDAGDDPRIEDALKPGQTVLVQVTKDPMGTKGPRLTMHISLAGRYVVLAPNSDLFGISRKLSDDERDRLRKLLKKLRPEGHGVIARTASAEATEDALQADLERLVERWEKVRARADEAKALTAVYEEPQLVVKVIRDHFGSDFERCIVDDADLFEQVRSYLEEVAPDLLDRVELYEPKSGERETPRTLFEAYDVDEQLRKAMGRKVWLPSGGYLIIEATEAMKVIDVNTGKFTGGKDSNLEEVVLKTNLEAAEEIVRQLRLRDMGGIIIIDFIDMLLKTNQDQVIRRLKRELLRDRTKTRVSDISRLGLVQMTRKNVSAGLVESFSHRCEECDGLGYISEFGG